MEQLGPHWIVINETDVLNIFQKFVENFQVSLNLTRINRYSVWLPVYLFDNI